MQICACGKQDKNHSRVINVGVLPDMSSGELRHRFKNLVMYLEQKTDMKFKFIPSNSYQEMLEQFILGKIDLARFGGYTYLKANEAVGAVPLVMRDIDLKFRSYFVCKTESKYTSLSELKGIRFGFGSKLSTSGHLMPRYFLIRKHIIPENFFKKIIYTGTHENTLNSILNNKIDAGVVNAVIYRKLMKSHPKKYAKLKVFVKTPYYADYVWTVKNNLPENIKQKILYAFLDLSDANKVDAQILESVGANAYLPATVNDFQQLLRVAKQLKLLK